MVSTTADQAELLRLRRLRARHKRATTKLEDFAHRLETLHADRSGAFRMMYPVVPLIPDEWSMVERSVRRNTADAAKGCPHCVAWLEQTADLRARIDTLRNTRLPERAPDYDGPTVMPVHALRAGKRRAQASVVRNISPERRAQLLENLFTRLQSRAQCAPVDSAEFARSQSTPT